MERQHRRRSPTNVFFFSWFRIRTFLRHSIGTVTWDEGKERTKHLFFFFFFFWTRLGPTMNEMSFSSVDFKSGRGLKRFFHCYCFFLPRCRKPRLIFFDFWVWLPPTKCLTQLTNFVSFRAQMFPKIEVGRNFFSQSILVEVTNFDKFQRLISIHSSD